VVSGLLQSGYCSGYLIASAIFAVLFVHVGWRGIFLVGLIPSLLLIPYVYFAVEESPLYKDVVKPASVSIFAMLRDNWKISLYCIILMTAFNHFSHGSQDFYPNYMEFRGFTPALLGTIAILYNIGGILGCWLIASMSQKYGRRRTMIAAALLAVPTILPWAFSSSGASQRTGARRNARHLPRHGLSVGQPLRLGLPADADLDPGNHRQL
jgi:SHS family lactate transporter-like MFS transporter